MLWHISQHKLWIPMKLHSSLSHLMTWEILMSTPDVNSWIGCTIHEPPIQHIIWSHSSSRVSLEPSVQSCTVPPGDPIYECQGPIEPNSYMPPLITSQESGLEYSLPHYTFYSYIFLPRFVTEFRICARIFPVISLLFQHLWWLSQRHKKSNYNSSCMQNDTASWEVTGHSECVPWIIKSLLAV